MIVVPFASTTDIPLDFAIAMGVRAEDTTWKLQVQKLINENYLEMLSILKSYNVPRVDDKKKYDLLVQMEIKSYANHYV